VVAIQIALIAEELPQILKFIVGREKPKKSLPAAGDLDEWFSFYKNHRRVMNSLAPPVMTDDFFIHGALLAGLKEILPTSQHEAAMELQRLAQGSYEMMSQLREMMGPVPFPPDEKFLAATISSIESEARTRLADGGPFDRVMASSAGQFSLRVWLPCWILYKTYPAVLLRRARRGCDASLERLVRLDKVVLADAAIARRWASVMLGSNEELKARYRKAMEGTPAVKLTAKAINHSLMGLISQIAMAMHCPVTAPEIAELFDRIARVRGGSDEQKEFGWAENLTRAIHRNRDWPSVAPIKFNPDN
jgi:hypothetical protein